jgi:hypothetical protein
MLIKITRAEAERLMKKAGYTTDTPDFVRDVNPVHLEEGIHLTYLRADQGTGKAGYHINVPKRKVNQPTGTAE